MGPQSRHTCLPWQAPFQLSVPLSGPSLVQALLLLGQRDAPVARECYLQVVLLLSVERKRGRGDLSLKTCYACYYSFLTYLRLSISFYFFLSYLMSAVGSCFFLSIFLSVSISFFFYLKVIKI